MRISFIIVLLFLSTFSHAKLTVRSSLPWMQNLGTVTDCVINNPAFRMEVAVIPKFCYQENRKTYCSEKNGIQVVADFDKMNSYTISTYWYVSKGVIATTYKYDKTTLYLNTRANPRKMPAMVNTVIHETRHLMGDSHGSNSPKGKEQSIPYWLGSLSEKYVPECML